MADNLNKLATLGTVKDLAERTKSTFRTSEQVEEAITAKGYQTASQVEQTISGKGYQTEEDVEGLIAEKGYQTKNQVDDAISAKVSSVYKPGGSVTAANLPTPSADNLGMVYNVSDAFTTDAKFLEGANKKHPAGTNIVVVQDGGDYKLDVLAGMVDLSGLAEKVGSAVNGHLAALDGNGNLTDSGKAASDFVGSVTAGSTSGTIKVDGVDVPVCDIASDEEAEAVLDEVFK